MVTQFYQPIYQINNKRKPIAQHRFGNMAGLVLNSSSVFQLNFSAKLKISSSISATSPSREPLADSFERQKNERYLYENQIFNYTFNLFWLSK